MSEGPPNEKVPTPPPRDVLREARRLARLRHLRLVTSEPQVSRVHPTPDPKEAA
jgi:hypothetical protein